ncbi:acetyltransferase [Ahrensia sp. R2A130]|uniref:acetyltransferase n=1 Tax=Ahrensia sp. R2A130 TaxID=744979 RepID=UPI0001E0C330|nr:acetyltransferase [Ahrensia sp. R2A130]EFL90808.1 pilin glycosylation protein [Ahrensia sp. R2A130]
MNGGGDTLHILGAGGHAAVVADCAGDAGYSAICLYADAEPLVALPSDWSFELTVDPVATIAARGGSAHVAIGDNALRGKFLAALLGAGVDYPAIFHQKCSISRLAKIGDGTVVLAGGVVNARAELGQGVIVNSGAVVEHDCRLADAVHLSPRAAIAGGVTIGARSWIGIGAVVRESITIGDDVVVGAGAAVVNDVPSGTTVVGVPAKPI